MLITLFRPIPTPTEYFTVNSGQEMDLASVIVMIFTRYTIFGLYFSSLRDWIRHCIDTNIAITNLKDVNALESTYVSSQKCLELKYSQNLCLKTSLN